MRRLILILFSFLSISLSAQVMPVLNPALGYQETEAPAPSYFAWYIADAANYTASNDSITQWDDLSGNDRHLVQPAYPARRPVGHGDSIIFSPDGNNLYYLSANLTQPFTVYMVINYRLVVDATESQAWFNAQGSTNFIAKYQTGNSIALFAGGFLGWNTQFAPNTWAILSATFNGANSSIRINELTPSTGDAGSNSFANLYFGSTAGNDFVSDIWIKEIRIKQDVTELSEIQDLNSTYSIY